MLGNALGYVRICSAMFGCARHYLFSYVRDMLGYIQDVSGYVRDVLEYSWNVLAKFGIYSGSVSV